MTSERRLLLACLVEAHADVIREIVARPVRWDEVIQRAQRTSISAALADALMRAGVEVPEPLSSAYVQNCAQNQLLLADLTDITKLLASEGIASVPLKGAALAIRDPRHARVRHMDDIDLLVEKNAFSRARAILVEHGHSDDALLASPRGTPIDLHVRAPGSGAPFDVVMSATDVIALDGVDVHVPTPPALRDQLAVHVVVHHGGLPKYWPRHVLDFTAIDGPSAPGSRLAAAAVGLTRHVREAVVDEVSHGARRQFGLSSFYVFPSRRRAAVIGVACIGAKAAAIVAEDGLKAGHRMLRPDGVLRWSRVRGVAERWFGV